MNGHSKVTVNGKGSVEHGQSNNNDTTATNGKARLADSGIDIKLSTEFKRFLSTLDYFNISKQTACASHTSLSCHSSNCRCCCSDNFNSNSNNNNNIVDDNNKNVYTNNAVHANAQTALIPNNDCMSKSLDRSNTVSYC